ncbi:unnamed protein product [Triticum turgidum subsp. durum]|uniref:Expansin-like EG45 domain-containing protein n=1 Tax=Triticum turgidum subsp. durum TaxID=4567 RepID=A0A9R0W1C3_TRITD|nr:unnamed protein product [Triticum turgidum subsp. durum]
MATTRVSLLLLLAVALAGSVAGASAFTCTSGPCYNGTAAFYGDADGAGNEAGVCGYGPAVAKPPFNAMVFAARDYSRTAVGCGRCFNITCRHPVCNPDGVTVTFADYCSGGPCVDNDVIEMSGHAFSAMALPGRESELRASPTVPVTYQLVDCRYSSSMAYLVDPTATPERFTVVLLYVPGDAYPGLLTVHFKDESSEDWVDADPVGRYRLPKFTATRKMVAPITIKVEGHYLIGPAPENPTWSVTAADVIPVGWHGGKTYYAA